ncbi:F-box protein [Sporobolomyces salmoneus]|uniref:F-box protein n=1 Tax=Sporobolomyces salmoneus TaxID=183962 RepID=UPI003178045F
MQLNDLPPDLLVIILSHLDFPSLSRIVQTHSSFNSAWKEYPEQLCRAICIRTGLADSKTVGAAAPLQAGNWFKRGGLEDEPSEEELRDVIKEQRVMDNSFDGVKSWTQYARTRWRIDRNWVYGRHKDEVLEVDFAAVRAIEHQEPSSFWRFKIDPISRWILVTGLRGGVRAFDLNGQLAWYSAFPRGPYNHIELTYNDTTSFFCTAVTEFSWLVWRYHDNPDEPPPNNGLSADILNQLSPLYRSLDGRQRGFYPYSIVAQDQAEPCRASKLRFPKLIASTADERGLITWDFTQENPRMSWFSLNSIMDDQSDGDDPLNGEVYVTYLELDDESYFVGGNRSVQIMEAPPPDHTVVTTTVKWTSFPPPVPSGYRYLQPLIPRPLYRESGNNLRPWSAVHHDSKSQYLVGASRREGTSSAVLSITYRYRSALRPYSEKSREELEQRTMNLCLDGVKEISQLSVENDRAVFTVKFDLGHALFVVPLRPFNSLAEFVSNPPKPICLSYPLPCLSSPSRVESTSTEIFVPIRSDLWHHLEFNDLSVDSFARFKSQWAELGIAYPFSVKWQTLDGQTLVDYEKECLQKDSDGWSKLSQAKADFEVEVDNDGVGENRRASSAFMRFSFDV